MDAEAALLENSPTLSTISSDSTDATYSGPDSPYSPESPIIVTSSYKKKRNDEVTPRPTPRHPLPPRKPSFRIRPPYLMICISIIEVSECKKDNTNIGNNNNCKHLTHSIITEKEMRAHLTAT